MNRVLVRAQKLIFRSALPYCSVLPSPSPLFFTVSSFLSSLFTSFFHNYSYTHTLLHSTPLPVTDDPLPSLPLLLAASQSQSTFPHASEAGDCFFFIPSIVLSTVFSTGKQTPYTLEPVALVVYLPASFCASLPQQNVTFSPFFQLHLFNSSTLAGHSPKTALILPLFLF